MQLTARERPSTLRSRRNIVALTALGAATFGLVVLITALLPLTDGEGTGPTIGATVCVALGLAFAHTLVREHGAALVAGGVIVILTLVHSVVAAMMDPLARPAALSLLTHVVLIIVAAVCIELSHIGSRPWARWRRLLAVSIGWVVLASGLADGLVITAAYSALPILVGLCALMFILTWVYSRFAPAPRAAATARASLNGAPLARDGVLTRPTKVNLTSLGIVLGHAVVTATLIGLSTDVPWLWPINVPLAILPTALGSALTQSIVRIRGAALVHAIVTCALTVGIDFASGAAYVIDSPGQIDPYFVYRVFAILATGIAVELAHIGPSPWAAWRSYAAVIIAPFFAAIPYANGQGAWGFGVYFATTGLVAMALAVFAFARNLLAWGESRGVHAPYAAPDAEVDVETSAEAESAPRA